MDKNGLIHDKDWDQGDSLYDLIDKKNSMIKEVEGRNKFLSSFLEEAAYAGACGKDPARYLATKAPTVLQERIKALEAVVQDVVDYFEADYNQPDFYDRAVKVLQNAQEEDSE